MAKFMLLGGSKIISVRFLSKMTCFRKSLYLMRFLLPRCGIEMTKSQAINGGGENVGASRPHSHPLYPLGSCHFDQREKSLF